MARSYVNGLGVEIQKEGLPWDEMKNGDVLLNYGHTYHLYVIFIEDINPEWMLYKILIVTTEGIVRIKQMSDTRKNYEEITDKYKNHDGDESFLYDHIKPGDSEKYLGDLIKQCFESWVEIREN